MEGKNSVSKRTFEAAGGGCAAVIAVLLVNAIVFGTVLIALISAALYLHRHW